MRFLRICGAVIALVASTSAPIYVQSANPRVQTVGTVHTARFDTRFGIIQVHVASDAAVGDMIAGLVVAEAVGTTNRERDANLSQLNSWMVEWQGQRTPVSERRYEWQIPRTLSSGATLTLLDAEGRLLARTSLPVDPVPAPASRAQTGRGVFDLPTEGETGKYVAIRGPSDGKLIGKSVSVGGTQADLIAASPRQVSFRVPEMATGLLPLRFAFGDQVAEGRLRVLQVRLNAPGTQLVGGQRVDLSVTVTGLNGITEPMMLTMANLSAATVRVDNIDRTVTIEPRQVTRQGSFAVTRRMTALKAGPFEILASVGRPPLEQFPVQRSMNRTLEDWQTATGVSISPEANMLIQRSVLEARKELDDFLGRQQANQGDAETVFTALLTDYCFDLRDDSRGRRRVTSEPVAGPRLVLVALGQNRSGRVEIGTNEVRRLSFSEFLSQLVGHFTMDQAVGYLLVTSAPDEVPITIDGQRKGEMTDRRIVTSAGEHLIVVAGPKACRHRVTVSAFQVTAVNCEA